MSARRFGVNGRAQITVDPALLEPAVAQGKAPRSAILVTADEVYFHCGKALIRSDLWNPEKHVARKDFPSLGVVIAEQIGQAVEAAEAERDRGKLPHPALLNAHWPKPPTSLSSAPVSPARLRWRIWRVSARSLLEGEDRPGYHSTGRSAALFTGPMATERSAF